MQGGASRGNAGAPGSDAQATSRCPHCETELAPQAKFCSGCGRATPAPETEHAVGLDELDATRAWSGETEPGCTPLLDSDIARPGAILADRYRVLERIGQGGIGTVFRAEDQRLGQQVALKFVSERMACDKNAIAILVNEVKTARRVSHSHVCRVYDIGEVEGRTFVSMEYVDGEDLSSLLHRIGRLAGDKAVQIARQLCSGLHAAHERGVLHRDLKPANIMLDGDGNVRITDFGIAAAIGSLTEESSSSGTPAYMAPELFAGGQASVASDVYSLGLVLYEIYTGRRLFQAESMTELLRHHRRPVPPPTEFVQDIDEKVERLILSCLAKDPEQRPRSALAVLSRLPGGDPLAEALASGRTPSPELIAASGGTGSVRPRTAIGLIVALVAGLALFAGLESRVKLFARASLPKSAEVLADRARGYLEDLDLAQDRMDRAYGFEVDMEYVEQIQASRPDAADWQSRLSPNRPSLISFWYREQAHPHHLTPANIKGRISWSDPAPVHAGNVQVRLDPAGRLLELLAVPGTDESVEPMAVDWDPLFEAAGLDRASFESIAPSRVPHGFADARAAWKGSYPEPPYTPVRIEAAALQGQPIAWRVLEERWPGVMASEDPPPKPRSWRFPLRVGLVLTAIVLAFRSIRKRRGDARGAFLTGIVMFGLVAAFTVLAGDHDGSPSRIANLLVSGMMHGLVVAAEFSLYYFALEPHIRRLWPETLISWTRLVSGRLRDPLVGHHVLLGMSLGVVTVIVSQARLLIPRWAGHSEDRPLMGHWSGPEILDGLDSALGVLLEITVDFSRIGMMFFMALVLLRLVLRSRALTAVASTLVWATVWTTDGTWMDTFPWIPPAWLASAALAGAITVFAMRTGLLPLLVGFVFYGAFTTFPVELHAEAWYRESTVLILALVAGLVFWSSRAATRQLA